MWGRIVSSVSTALDINLATLSGCIDIVAVPQEDGSLRSTPFHLRFGKAKLLRSREKDVFIYVNDELVEGVTMKLGVAGEAYFVEELFDVDDDDIETSSVESSSPPLEPHQRGYSSPPSTFPESKRNPAIRSDFNHSSAPPSQQVSSGIYDLETPIRTLDSLSFNEGLVPTPRKATQDTSYSDSEFNLVGEYRLPVYRSRESSNPSKTPPLSPGLENERRSIELSMCGHLLYGTQEEQAHDEDVFNANILDWQATERDPLIWYHPGLVARFNGQGPYYPGKVALPLITSWAVFNRPPSFESVRTLLATSVKAEVSSTSLNDWSELNIEEEDSTPQQTRPSVNSCCSLQTPVKHYRKSLRPSSAQLEKMKLRPGANTVCFTVTSSLQGEKMVRGSIYLWPRNAKIVVSDVDGTITRSDVLGQLMPIVGRDWSHPGVAALFSKIRRSGYFILYLTARAIGQADSTREYLFGLTQDDSCKLPDGPLILSPDRLFFSFKREVIDRKPFVFKIAALRDFRSLFPPRYNPFFAGFGNRDTDHRAYVHIGIPEGKVFIIDHAGVVHHINTSYAKTYESMGEICEAMFPYRAYVGECDVERAAYELDDDEQFNNLNYWRSTGWDWLEGEDEDGRAGGSSSTISSSSSFYPEEVEVSFHEG